MTGTSQPEALRNASMIVARDVDGTVAALAAEFPESSAVCVRSHTARFGHAGRIR
ncbi:hypothetical protein [Streptomyces sp. NPDC000878]